jgi:hypothetical protein
MGLPWPFTGSSKNGLYLVRRNGDSIHTSARIACEKLFARLENSRERA